MIKFKRFLIFLFFLVLPSFSQEINQEKETFWKCYLNDNTVLDSVVLDERQGNFLLISKNDSLYKIPIYSINKISRNKSVESEGKEILGVIIGSIFGGGIGILIAPKTKLFGSTFIPHGKEYIAGGAIIGGIIGYFVAKPSNEERYQLAVIKWEERLKLIDTLIENKY